MVLSKEQADVAGDALLEPRLAAQDAKAARLAKAWRRPWIVRRLGKWTGVLGLAGFTLGLLIGTWFWGVSLPAVGVGSSVGAVVGIYLDRNLRRVN